MELHAAWRALAGEENREGWRTIQIGGGERPVRAGRHHPDDAESLLIGFRNVQVPANERLPRGFGFHAAHVDLGATNDGRIWIALSREPGASLDLFAILAENVLEAVSTAEPVSDQNAMRMLLGRIDAWQSFMQRPMHDILSAEAEIGLAGELIVLVLLVAAGAPASMVVDAWRGPLDGLQDFIFQGGALEVKTCIGSGSFPAKISSLEQLDDTLVRPLFVAATRLSVRADGKSLPEIAADARMAVAADRSELSAFDSRLIHAGLLPSHAALYTRRFVHLHSRCLPVTPEFPRLTRANVSPHFRRVIYEIDLDMVNVAAVDIHETITAMGIR